MRHYLLSILISLVCCSLASAQRFDQLEVMFIEGVVSYQQGKNSPKSRVYTGTSLGAKGMLILKKRARVEFIYQERFVKLNEPGKYDLDVLLKKPARRRNFMQRFVGFLFKGLDQSKSEKNLEKHYLENQQNARGHTRGFSDTGIAGRMPVGGNLSPGLYNFSWRGAGQEVYYDFQIIDSLSNETVFLALSKDTSIAVDLGSLYLQPGNTYFWEVFVVKPDTGTSRGLGRNSSPEERTPQISFRVIPEKEASLLEVLKQDPDYRETKSVSVQALMQAMTLEEAGFVYAADQIYHEALNADPDNPVLRRNYATFLARWQQLQMARQILQGLE